MKKRMQRLRKKIASLLVSVLILAFFFIPMFQMVKWLRDVGDNSDPRKTVAALPFHTRSADASDRPLIPFEEPIVTIAFDDGWLSVYTHALPIMQREGLHSSQFVMSGSLENFSYMSVAQMKSMQAMGHEIGAHTITHADLTTLDDLQLDTELKQSKDVLSKHFGPVRDFTSPYGAYNDHTLAAISKHYRSQKNAEGDPHANVMQQINIKSQFNPLNYTSYSVRRTTTLKDIQTLLDTVKAHNGWLVLTYHQVDSGTDAFGVSPAEFEKQMKLISKSNIRSAKAGQFLDAYYDQRQP